MDLPLATMSHLHFINADRERFWVKFHLKTQQGRKHRTNAEAAEVVGRTREPTPEDIDNAIAGGDFPKWRLCIQVMPEADADKTPNIPLPRRNWQFSPRRCVTVFPRG